MIDPGDIEFIDRTIPDSTTFGPEANATKPFEDKAMNPFVGWPGHPEYYKLLMEAARIHASKNQDYGGGNPLGNFEEAINLGIPMWRGVLVRLSDKWSRIRVLAKKSLEGIGASVKDESIEDTLLDMANYALLTIVSKRERGEDIGNNL